MMSRHAANPIYFNVKKEKKNKNWTFTKLVNLPPLLRPLTPHFCLITPHTPPHLKWTSYVYHPLNVKIFTTNFCESEKVSL